MAEKLRNRLTVVGMDQLKEGVEFKKILVLMRTLFENWEERNKFLRKWFMQVKKLKQRDTTLENSLKVVDKKLLENSVINMSDASEIKRICNAVPVARAVDFFTNLRRLWGDWDKIRRRILNIMGKYIESEDEKRMGTKSEEEYLISWENILKVKMKRE